MRLQILQEDIDNGIPQNSRSCPLANALVRTFARDAIVTNLYAQAPIGDYYLFGQDAKTFIERFDISEPVEPTEFQLRGPYKESELEFYQTFKRDTRTGG